MSTEMNERLEHKLLFVWDQSRCTVTEARLTEHPEKNAMFKELKHVWGEYKSYNSSNKILVDDSPYKSFLNSVSALAHLILMLYMFIYLNKKTFVNPEGDFVRYLKKLADADNVQEFMKQNPFGQSPITEGYEDWNFYSNIVSNLGLQDLPKELKRRREAPKRYTPEVFIAYMFRNMLVILQQLVMLSKIALIICTKQAQKKNLKAGGRSGYGSLIVTEASSNPSKQRSSLLMGQRSTTGLLWSDIGTGNNRACWYYFLSFFVYKE
ncbi:unnamed protein product [Coffea canephora]|uniref:FCP1 homology domain-containing protein n=1 Tax=Coffea canephora TaxID=49390 RepID=A0A068UVL9_COFCA|nr:unnamed protein product [Coffea canephora]